MLAEVAEEGEREWRGGRTVDGRAWRRSVDCVSHSWAVFRYGIAACAQRCALKSQ